ncbi:MAG: mechanosensitive ion channel [Planctomycetales bacterium]|nr:mechanosensitive ion channel [Planctomycetales bacterium]
MFRQCLAHFLLFLLAASVEIGGDSGHANAQGRPQWPSLDTSNRVIATNPYPSTTVGNQSVAEDFGFASRSDVSSDRSTSEVATRFAQWNRDLAERSPETIAGLASKNADLSDQLAQLSIAAANLQTRLARANQKLSDIRSDYESVSGKLAEYGLTPTIGLLLRHRKEQLDSWQTQDNENYFARAELRRTQQDALELELILGGEDQIEQQAQQLVAASDEVRSNAQSTLLQQQVVDLLRQRAHLVNELKGYYRTYHQDLDRLDSTASAISTLTADFRKLINRHATWIRSGEPVGFRDFSNAKAGIAALLEFRHTRQLGRDLKQKLSDDQLSGIILLMLIGVLFAVRWRLKSWLVAIGRKSKMKASGRWRIVAAGGLTLGVAAIVPLIGYVMAQWLNRGIVSELMLQVANGLYASSLIALLVELPRQLLRPFGLVDKHLSQTFSTRAEAFKDWSIAGLMLVPGAFAITMLGQIDHGMWRDSLGRFAFFVTMLVVAGLAHFAFRPGKGFLCPIVETFGGRLAVGFGHLWYAIALSFPVVMGILSTMGYGYTAGELIKRATLSAILVMVAGVVWKMGQLGFQQIWRNLTQPKVEPRYDDYGLIEEPEIDEEVNETHVVLKHQIGFLCQCVVGVGLVTIFAALWVDVIPNMNMANPVLWTVQDTLTTYNDDGQGQSIASTVVQASPVTLLNLVWAAAILFAAIHVSRLLPNLFDALVLQRVDYDEGMEHLILVVGRGILFAIGCFVACRLVGVRWQTIQWLMVGITIGVGFGLQDIVRNILGGLVVLFARPVNVGDRVTVGRLTGRIASQTLRTTILADDEGRELQIPNRKFLSDEITNWRGAGKLTTIAIEVSVRREERPIDIGRMLGEWAAAERFVLQSPGPQVTLVCIAKHTQRFELHVWTEEDRDPKKLQLTLLETIRKHLLERNLLAKSQPAQPVIRHTELESTIDSPRHKRRSA